MKLAFYKVENCMGYERHTFDWYCDNPAKIEEMLQPLLEKDEAAIVNLEDWHSIDIFTDEYNDEIYDGGWWSVLINDYDLDDCTAKTKQEYLTKRDRLEDEIKNLHRKLRELDKNYIKNNQPYPIGTKLRVWKDADKSYDAFDHIGIVKDYEIVRGDEVQPILAKVRKDGKANKQAIIYLSWWRKPNVEVISE